MDTFTKLKLDILYSSVWQASKETRILWITMLAMCDETGKVRASLPGLAHCANLSLSETECSLSELESPDPYSRTKDLEGRRVVQIDGGWQVINYLKHRRGNPDERRAYKAQWAREHRASVDRLSTDCPQVSTLVHGSASASVVVEDRGCKGKGELPAIPDSLNSAEFCAAWNDWLTHRQEIRKKVTFTAASKQLKKLAGWGQQRAISAIIHSIASGWTGIFEDTQGTYGRTNSGKSGVSPIVTPEPGKYDGVAELVKD